MKPLFRPPDPSRTRRADRTLRRPVVAAALFVVLAIAAYLPSIEGDFFSDDFLYVVGNVRLASVPLAQPWKVFASRTNPFEYLPVRDLSYRLDLALFGPEPTGYHLHNMGLYALACFAGWLCFRSTLSLLAGRAEPHGGSGAGWTCAIAVALFAAHPAHVESVAWISGRKEILSGLFALLSLWQFAEAILPERPRVTRLLASYVLFTVALMSKATAVPVAAVAILMVLVRGRMSDGPRLARTPIRLHATTLPMVLVAAGWVWGTLEVGRATTVRVDPFESEILRQVSMPWINLAILGYLVKIAFAPWPLRLFYEVQQQGLAGVLAQLLGGIALAAGGLGGFAAWRRGSAAGWGLALFVLFSLPYLQLVGFHTWSMASERFLFLPVLGLSLTLAAGLRRLGRWGTWTAVVLAVGGIVATFAQSAKWGSIERLVADSAALAPKSFQAQNLRIDGLLRDARFEEATEAASGVRDPMGRTLLLRYVRAKQALAGGDHRAAHEAAQGLEFIVNRRGRTPWLLLLGQLAEIRGDDFEAARRYHQTLNSVTTTQSLEDARRSLERVRAIHAERLESMRRLADARPGDLVAQGNLANLEMELFFLPRAEARFRSILKSHPGHVVARYNLGLTLLREGRHAEAVAELSRAIEGGMSTAVAWNNLAIAREESGDVDGARAAFQRALDADPRYCHAAINLGRLLLALRRSAPARESFRHAREQACTGEFDELIDIYMTQIDLRGGRGAED